MVRRTMEVIMGTKKVERRKRRSKSLPLSRQPL
jgi:hypothetical protein